MVPNPGSHWYTCSGVAGAVATNDTATAAPSVENRTDVAVFGTAVAGSAYFAPNPGDHGNAKTRGALVCAIAMSVSLGEKCTSFPCVAGSVAGFAYLTPNPGDHGYVVIQGVELCPTANDVPEGLNAAEIPLLVGRIDGLAYLVPNPDEDH